jgi:primosomal protein N' (replication factor Y)
MTFFADILLPISLPKPFTYEINRDEALFLKKGMRVAVPFGKSKIVTGLVYGVHQNPPAYETKEIYQILDTEPLVTSAQIDFWEWIASYYLCTIGEVMKAALPGILLIESETKFMRHRLPDDSTTLSDDAFLLMEAFDMQAILSLKDISGILDKKNVMPVVKGLMEKQLIQVEEVLQEGYKPKTEKYLTLNPQFSVENDLRDLLEKLNRASKQKAAFLAFVSLYQVLKKPIRKVDVVQKIGKDAAALQKLIEKEILLENKVEVDRVIFDNLPLLSPKNLTDDQKQALAAVQSSFLEKDCCLLHGVTSSGKTELYVDLIGKYISLGKQVLYLVPEIALTTQIVMRIRGYFGDSVAVYHSKYNAKERVEVWQKVLEGSTKAAILIGARSAIWLPFSNLGLVIVDEEHETSYKQFEPNPRYNARDAAIYLAKSQGAKVLLGTATPSLESYYNAQKNKYGFVKLDKRFGEFDPPEIRFVDLREAYKRKQMRGFFSNELLSELENTLSKNQKVILFKNRRGFAPVVECKDCGNVPYCPNCDVSLTYHQGNQKLRCHYCGFAAAMPSNCFACGSIQLDTKGFGTEQVEEDLKKMYPELKIGRMDSDTTRGKNAFDKIIKAFEAGDFDVLIGTQMISKGLNFKQVGLVGVLQADDLLHHPDFRAHERCFQLLQQLSGRVGRGDLRGKVIIQTYSPGHEILQQVAASDFDGMFAKELQQRQDFEYPPFQKLIKITLKHRDYHKTAQAAEWIATGLKTMPHIKILGPETPIIGRIRNEHIKQVLVKIHIDKTLQERKNYIYKLREKLLSTRDFRSVKIILDVDNY